jgi:regulator of RNase E activity RraA
MPPLDPETLKPDTLEKLRQVSTATITSQLIKIAGLRSRSPLGIRPINPARAKFVGPAVTLRYAPMREDLDARASTVHPDNPTRHVIETAPAGSVLVVDMGGNIGGGAIGDILAARLIHRGIAGVVADRGMRDIGPLMHMDLPVHCRAFAPPPSSAALLAVGTGEPVGCGGTLVYPGDIVCADEDGAVVIPRHLADQVATDGLFQEQIEVFIKARVLAGEPIDGFYPATERTKAEYKAWIEAGRPRIA